MRGLEPRFRERSLGGQAPVLVVRFTDPSQHRADLAHEPDIRASDRAGATHHRHDVSGEEREVGIHQFRRNADAAGQSRVDADRHRIADDRDRERRSGAEMMGTDQPHVEGVEVLGRPFDVLHRPNAGRRPINRLALRDTVLDDDAGQADSYEGLGIGAERDAALSDLGEYLETEGRAIEGKRRLLHKLGPVSGIWHE
jgi:hypothetical protein